MNSYLRQSTASQGRMTPAFVDSTDFFTPETGLTIANTDVKLCVNGGASANKNSGGGTHRVNGKYSLTFDATDTATVGELDVSIVVSGALPVYMKFWVLEEAIYDALFGASATGLLPANATQLAGQTITAGAGVTFPSSVASPTNITAAAGITLADGAITAAKIAADAITAAKIADSAIDRATFAADTGLQTIRSNTAQAGAAGTITLDASASASDDFYNSTLIVITGGTGVGQGRLVSDYVGTTKVASVTPNWTTNPDNTSTFAIIPMAAGASAADIADTVWDEARSGHVAAGSFGEGVIVTTNNDKTGYALSSAAVQAIWDALTSALTTVGSVGKRIADNLNATVSSRATQSSVDTIDGIVDDILVDTATIGTPAGASVSADIAAVKVDAAAVKAKTDNLPAAPAATGDIPSAATNAAQVRTELTTELGRIDAAVSTRATPAQVVTELATAVDALPTAVENAAAVLAAAVTTPIDANVQKINDVTLTGDGSATPWGPTA